MPLNSSILQSTYYHYLRPSSPHLHVPFHSSIPPCPISFLHPSMSHFIPPSLCSPIPISRSSCPQRVSPMHPHPPSASPPVYPIPSLPHPPILTHLPTHPPSSLTPTPHSLTPPIPPSPSPPEFPPFVSLILITISPPLHQSFGRTFARTVPQSIFLARGACLFPSIFNSFSLHKLHYTTLHYTTLCFDSVRSYTVRLYSVYSLSMSIVCVSVLDFVSMCAYSMVW